MMHDVLSQYFPSIKNGANTFYINKVSKTHYSVEGFNSLILNQTSRNLNLEIATKYHLLENGLFKKSEMSECITIS